MQGRKVKMKKFKVIASWVEYSQKEVEAETLEQAIEIAEENPENFESIGDETWDSGDWRIREDLSEEVRENK